MGGESRRQRDNVASWEGAQRLINTAIEAFGDLHVVVTTRHPARPRADHMTEEEWDAVIAVHLKGTSPPVAGGHLLAREEQGGKPTNGRIINTTSVSGIYATLARPTTAPPRQASPRSPNMPRSSFSR